MIFNPSNGGLTGIPSDEDVGVNENIIITVSDIEGETDSLPAFSISVENVNDVPVAVDDHFEISESENGYLLDVLQNDTDDDGDSLTILSFRTHLEGLSIEDGKLRFIPKTNISSVEFEYLVSDGNGGQDIGLVSLSILSESIVSKAPVITLPKNVEVNATGLYTRVDLGIATAIDANGNKLPVSLLNDNTLFVPGKHKVYWQATDDNGNSSVGEQQVIVNPLVSFTKGRKVVEGNTVSVGVVLNGEAPEYPVLVAYELSGTADEGDHSLFDGILSLESTRGEIELDIYADGLEEETETIILNFTGELNQGSQNTHTIEIVDSNVAPQVSLKIMQEDKARTIIDRSGGSVVISALVTDANADDSSVITWKFLDGITDLDNKDTSFSFDPSELEAGQYRIEVLVTDSGIPSKEVVGIGYFELTDEIPVLTSIDSDGDLVPDDIEGLGDDDGDGIANYLDSISATNILQSDVKEQKKFLIEGPIGAQLRKGRYSAGNENGGAVLSGLDLSTQLMQDLNAQHLGGVFDFIIYGLPEVGKINSIALPQQQAIPSTALYRQFINDEWVDFIIDEQNAVYSTAGEPGYCPPPEANIWQAGLTEGHWCVSLSIQDGGPNDGDGLVNGMIFNSGAVAVVNSDNNSPVVVDDQIAIAVDVSVDVDVLDNDIDEDGDTLTISSSIASFGQSMINENGELTYTPAPGFIGVDHVVYSVSDGNGGTASGILTISVHSPKSYSHTTSKSGLGSIDWYTFLFISLLCLRGFKIGIVGRR